MKVRRMSAMRVRTKCFWEPRVGRECGEGGGGALGPVAAGEMGNGKKGTPVVGEAIECAGRERRVADGQGGEIILGPAGEFAAEGVLDLGFVGVEVGIRLTGLGFGEGDEHGAVAQGGRERADAGEHGGGIGFEAVDAIARAFATVGVGAGFVAGVQEAAHFGIFGQPGIEFIQEQRGLLLVHDAEQDGGAHVFGAEWARDHGGHDIESGGLAAAAFGGEEVEAR